MASDAPKQGIRTWRAGRATVGALGLVFAILYILEGQSLNFGRMRAPGPGIFPLIVGVIFALVSAGVIADALLSKSAGRATFPKGEDLKRLVVVFVSFVAYAALFNILGFPVTTVALVTIFTRVVGNISWPKAAISGVGMTFLMWATFVLLLGVRLPTGIWS
jgi:putative tricarboxylic transport membrane protein